MMAIDKLQKAMGYQLFDVSGMTKYQEEQKVVAAEFKTIGETVDSLKGKFKSLFMATPIPKTGNGGGETSTGDLVFGSGGAPTGGGTGGGVKGGGVKSQPVNELMPTTNLLPTIGKLPDQLRSVTAETQRAKEETDAFAKAQDAAGKAIQVTDDNITRLKKGIEDLNTGFKNIIEGTLTDLSVALGEQLGNALSGAGFNIKSFLLPVAEAVISFGKLAIQVGIAALGIKTALKSLNPAIAIAGGIALVALGTLVKNSLSAPKLAEGGLAYGPTMATVGDNRNARVDPEVIAPLSKLKSMMGDMGVGGTLETRISGNDLIILLNRSQKGLNRVQ
jgi:hypothetical protein